MNRILVSSVVVALAASSASAETKSWAALKNNVPTSSEVLLSVDVKALGGSASFGKVVASIPDVGPAIDLIKQTCKIDVIASISDLSVAIKTKGQDQIIFAIGLDGIDETKMVDCLTKFAKMKSAKAKVTKKAGKISEYAIDDGNGTKTLYAMWPAKDVVVISIDPDDKASLDPYINGKAVQGDMATYFGKLPASGTVGWVAAVVGEEHVKGVYGSATLAKGTFTGTMRIVADSAKDATNIVKDANDGFKKGISNSPADVARVLKAIKVGQTGDTVSLDGSISDADLPAFMASLVKL